MLLNTVFIFRAVSFADKKKTVQVSFFRFQVRHKASKKVYAMKLLSKFEMVSERTQEKSSKSYIASVWLWS